MARIKELVVYPIKACQGTKVETAIVDQYGFKYDRNWMVIDKNKRFVSQREFPKLCLVKPRIDEENGILYINAPNMKEISISIELPQNGVSFQVKIWDDIASATDLGDEIGSWFSEYLGGPFRLVKKDKRDIRKLSTEFFPPNPKFQIEPQTAFSDGYPFLLISTSSLDDLNSKLDKPAGMINFRPNIVVEGCTFPFEEDTWKQIQIAGQTFYVVSRCTRCTVTTVDTETGKMTLNTLKTLSKYRRIDPQSKVSPCFGMNVVHTSTGFPLSVGENILTAQAPRL